MLNTDLPPPLNKATHRLALLTSLTADIFIPPSEGLESDPVPFKESDTR